MLKPPQVNSHYIAKQNKALFARLKDETFNQVIRICLAIKFASNKPKDHVCRCDWCLMGNFVPLITLSVKDIS